METRREWMARRGLILPKPIVRRLDQLGIHARADVSLEYQHLAQRYVIRGVESGGAIAEMGRYVAFAGESGEQLVYLQPLEGLNVNGVHAVVVAPVVVRIDLFRAARTCQLLITKHKPGTNESGRRPLLRSTLVFHGVDGFLDVDLWGKHRDLAGSLLPRFWSRGGEVVEVPNVFRPAVRAATHGVSCVGCSHSHFLCSPTEIASPGFITKPLKELFP
jgi:hypothetical protein